MITKDMNVAEVLKENESLVPVFYQFGMFCIGCALAHGETIEQACLGHGIDPDAMVEALNRANDAK